MRHAPLFVSLLFSSAIAFSAPDAEIIQVKNNIYYIVSPQGGNVAVSTGKDGVFVIDDQLTVRNQVIDDAIKRVSEQGIQFILNTHYHYDHTGGNEHFGKKGAVIVAHENVRKRLSTKQFITFFEKELPALSKVGLPTITFESDISFHYNDDTIKVIYLSDAHTDGDSAAYFENENVIVTGDTVFNGRYPFIDVEHGGSIQGLIKAVEKLLALADTETIIVPGHGVLMNKQDLLAYQKVLTSVASIVHPMVKQGKSLMEVLAVKPSKAFDQVYGNDIISADAFVTFVYEGFKS